MKRSGVSTEFIQEALGHMDKKTTESYLDCLENEVPFSKVNRGFRESKLVCWFIRANL